VTKSNVSRIGKNNSNEKSEKVCSIAQTARICLLLPLLLKPVSSKITGSSRCGKREIRSKNLFYRYIVIQIGWIAIFEIEVAFRIFSNNDSVRAVF